MILSLKYKMDLTKKVWEWLIDQGVKEWRDNTWNYITPTGISTILPHYDGKYIVHRTQEEINILATTLVNLVKDRKVPLIKYKFEGSYTHSEYQKELPPILFYCKHSERGGIERILDDLGLTDKRWIEKTTNEDLYKH